jgi:pimeloyl-ACP methyl ester carboxylesterase
MSQPVAMPTTRQITLAHKPDSPISYTFTGSFSTTPKLVLFVNGLMGPQASWFPAIGQLHKDSASFAMMTYDRFGQGSTTSRDPRDAQAEDPKYGHSMEDVVEDLGHLLDAVIAKEGHQGATVELILVGNSIGCPIIRLFTARHASSTYSVRGIIFLDSMIANTDFVSALPDPDQPGSGFDPSTHLGDDCTLEQYHAARKGLSRLHPSTPNPEGLDRRNAASLLPKANEPVFPQGPYLLVVGHDGEVHAKQSVGMLQQPISLTRKFSDPMWQEYNQGLLSLVDVNKRLRKEVVIAEGAGHVIQKDRPDLVAGYVEEMLAKLGWV